MGLLFDTLNQLNAADANKVTSIPRYDKSMRGGRGDRAGPEAWSTVIGIAEFQSIFIFFLICINHNEMESTYIVTFE